MHPIVIAALVLTGPSGLRQQPVTDINWRHHPTIVEVRALVAVIDSTVGHGRLIQRTDSAVCDGGRVHLTAHLLTDSAGRTRKYVLVGGSDDSAGDATYYYDAKGYLRFIFARTNAVNGTRREDRIYFDSTGTQVFANHRQLRGPGYAGGFGEPIRDPKADFHSLCG